MKTLYLTDSSANIWVDPEENTVGRLSPVDRYDVRHMFLATEPMHIVYEDGEYREEADAKKGELIVTFYKRKGFTKRVAIVKNKTWKDNIEGWLKAEQKATEEWLAKQQTAVPCEGDCAKCESKDC